MKVLKFCGSALTTPSLALRTRNIIEESAASGPVIIVVTAIEGVTDQLIEAAQMALSNDGIWRNMIDEMHERHLSLIDTIVPQSANPACIKQVDDLFGQLKNIMEGISLVHDLSEKTQALVVSYGERIASLIVSSSLPASINADSTRFIFTQHVNGADILDSSTTFTRINEVLTNDIPLVVVPGFISSDLTSGSITNLGRGGSDYTAALIAAALHAEELILWTNSSGFTTADTSIISNAYTISQLSFVEAMELTNFGAKVIYPPAIYPVSSQHIPIQIMNIHDPLRQGTRIFDHPTDDGKLIRGISSIEDTTLITVSGSVMVGVKGVNSRIFSTLARNGISAFYVAQASSENSTSIGVSDEDASKAVAVLNEEYAGAIATGAMAPIQAERHLATIAVVGENMRHNPSVPAKLFTTLTRAGIAVKSYAQGAMAANISFVVDGTMLHKALATIHDAFFLSPLKELNLYICGIGTVGSRLIEQIKTQSDVLRNNNRLRLNVVGIASSHNAIYAADGLKLETITDIRKLLAESPASTPSMLYDHIVGMNLWNSVFVDCTASAEITALYQPLLEHNVSVIAANKLAASGPLDAYRQLKHTAIERGATFRFETNVGAGLPIIGTINDLINSGDRILQIEAVLSGTLGYIFSQLSSDLTFSQAVKQAQQLGYSEPDPRADLSLTDVVRKIVILAREAGYQMETADVKVTPLLSENFFRGSLEDFWNLLPSVDPHFERCRIAAEESDGRLTVVASFAHGEASVSLKTIGADHPFYHLEGSNNAILLTTARYRDFPMLIQGYGAGASVTAAGVFSNIMSIANI